MTVAVTEECIGTGGCESKSAALRVRIKQSCEVGTVCEPPETLCNPPMVTQHGKGRPNPRLTEKSVDNTNRKEDAQFLPTLKGLGFLTLAQFL